MSILRKFRLRKPPKPMHPCPHCGEAVTEGAPACRACGSDTETGWSDQPEGRSADLADRLEEFDYEGYLDREFAGTQPTRARLQKVIGILVIVGMILSLFVVYR